MDNQPNPPKIPKRFIEERLAKNMRVGEIAYIPIWGGVQLDQDQRLWIFSNVSLSKQPRQNGKADGDADVELMLWLEPSRPALKIERIEDGYRVFLYEYFEFLSEKRFNCETFNVCESSTDKPCRCRGLIRGNLLKSSKLHAEAEYLPVTAFDEPTRKLNDPEFINSLTPEMLLLLQPHELQILLVNSSEDENYLIAQIVQEEINRRKESI